MRTELDELVHRFPGDRNESDWLDAIELLRRAVSESLHSDVQLGMYHVNDIPGEGSISACSRVRGKEAVPGLQSDSWEGVLCWTIGRNKDGHADLYVFPFRDGSVLQQRGRLADLGPTAETEEFLSYRFDDGTFFCDGWRYPEGSGEWAEVSKPGSVYLQKLTPEIQRHTFTVGQQMTINFRLPVPIPDALSDSARISLVHVNRNQENTNLVPWTARPPKSNCQHSISITKQILTRPDIIRVPLHEFSIRGGWTPGRYHLAVRVQDLHAPRDWSWTCDISPPIKITIF